jgi:hypothetical protein
MKNETTKKAIISQNLDESIGGKRLKTINAAEGSYLLLLEIRELLEDVNNLLRAQMGLNEIDSARPQVKSEIKGKRKRWKIF